MLKLSILKTSRFKKSFKRVSGWSKFNQKAFEKVVGDLANLKKLEEKYKDHKLTGELKYFRECHIQPDLLLIYQIKRDELILILIDTGSHSDLFE